MNIPRLLTALNMMQATDVQMLKTYVRYPTVSNHAYATGYFQALILHEEISWDLYHYFLALLGQIRDDTEVRNTVMMELDKWQPNLASCNGSDAAMQEDKP